MMATYNYYIPTFHTSVEYIHNASCMKESWKKLQLEYFTTLVLENIMTQVGKKLIPCFERTQNIHYCFHRSILRHLLSHFSVHHILKPHFLIIHFHVLPQ